MEDCERGQREQDADIRLQHHWNAWRRATAIGEREDPLKRAKGDGSYGLCCCPKGALR